MSKTAIVIGAGFAGLSTSCYLSRQGYDVTLLEKNECTGGRASLLKQNGYTFDMGPSWYWMPDVFESFFGDFGKKPSDYYELVRLDPAYQVVYGQDDVLSIPADTEALYQTFESIEPGSSKRLRKFLKDAAYKYEVGIHKLVYKPGQSISELFDSQLITGLFKLQVFRSLSAEVRSLFSDSRLIRLLEFPVLFLGATAREIPALYSLMNYADLKLGTWYPMGGMYKVVEGMTHLAEELGVNIQTNTPVQSIVTERGKAKGVKLIDGSLYADVIVGAADYHHIEQNMLPAEYRRYSPKYWDKRVMSPSSLLFYIGVEGKLNRMLHHTLFFDENMDDHVDAIYKKPRWPERPLLYASMPSKTDPSVAPANAENLGVLIPLAPGLKGDDHSTRQKYYHIAMDRLERFTGQDIRNRVAYCSSFAQSEFIKRYNSFKANAYGLSNTLLQTAHLKPNLKSKLSNMYFSGQLTVPGPGVPPSLISGKIVADLIAKEQPS